MTKNTVSGRHLLNLVQEGYLFWEDLKGAEIFCPGIGKGAIEDVKERSKYIPLITVALLPDSHRTTILPSSISTSSQVEINSDTLKKDDVIISLGKATKRRLAQSTKDDALKKHAGASDKQPFNHRGAVNVATHRLLPSLPKLPAQLRVICLAVSQKFHAHCIAGKLLVENKVGGWVRPVPDPAGGAIPDSLRYIDGGQPCLLDIMELPAKKQALNGEIAYQSENILVDLKGWSKIGEWDSRRVAELVDHSTSLWTTSPRDSRELPLADAQKLDSSLTFIEITRCTIQTSRDQLSGQIKTRVSFTHNGIPFDLPVTDPLFKAKHEAHAPQEFHLEKAYACISISEPFVPRGAQTFACYKLVASLITPDLHD